MSNKGKKNDPKNEDVKDIKVTMEMPDPEEVAEAVVEAIAEPVNTVPVAEEAAWDVETWKSVARQRIGVSPAAIVGALSKKDKTIQYTEREIRALVEAFLNTPAR